MDSQAALPNDKKSWISKNQLNKIISQNVNNPYYLYLNQIKNENL